VVPCLSSAFLSSFPSFPFCIWLGIFHTIQLVTGCDGFPNIDIWGFHTNALLSQLENCYACGLHHFLEDGSQWGCHFDCVLAVSCLCFCPCPWFSVCPLVCPCPCLAPRKTPPCFLVGFHHPSFFKCHLVFCPSIRILLMFSNNGFFIDTRVSKY